jgi:hypothetical protein
VRARAAEEREVATLAAPDLCAEIAAWKAGDYAALPQGASAFVAQIKAIESSAGVGPFEEARESVILRRLRRYEGPGGRAIAKRVETFEARVAKRLSAAVGSERAKVAGALGVSAL